MNTERSVGASLTVVRGWARRAVMTRGVWGVEDGLRYGTERPGRRGEKGPGGEEERRDGGRQSQRSRSPPGQNSGRSRSLFGSCLASHHLARAKLKPLSSAHVHTAYIADTYSPALAHTATHVTNTVSHCARTYTEARRGMGVVSFCCSHST